MLNHCFIVLFHNSQKVIKLCFTNTPLCSWKTHHVRQLPFDGGPEGASLRFLLRSLGCGARSLLSSEVVASESEDIGEQFALLRLFSATSLREPVVVVENEDSIYKWRARARALRPRTTASVTHSGALLRVL